MHKKVYILNQLYQGARPKQSCESFFWLIILKFFEKIHKFIIFEDEIFIWFDQQEFFNILKNILYLVKAKNQSYFLESYYFCLQLLSQYIVIHHSIIEEAKDYLKVNCKFIFHPLKLGNLISAIFSFIISKMAYFLKATAYNFINPIYNFILIFLLNKFGFQDVNYSDSNEIIHF